MFNCNAHCRYDVPENALVLWNQFAVHHDPLIWADPEHFNPEANLLRRVRVRRAGPQKKPENERDKDSADSDRDCSSPESSSFSSSVPVSQSFEDDDEQLPGEAAPEGYSDEERVEVVNAEYVLTFGLGKRACLGEALARQELFLFFIGLLQRFEIVPSPEHPLPSQYAARSNFKVVRDPLPFHVCFRRTD